MRFVPVTSIADALPLWFISQICESFHVLYAAGSVIANVGIDVSNNTQALIDLYIYYIAVAL